MNDNDHDFVLNELARVHGEEVHSDHEEKVRGDIMIWGYQVNIDRAQKGLPGVKFDNFDSLIAAYWEEKISQYGYVPLAVEK